MADRIFISYRRDDVPGDARGLRDGLVARFGRGNIFMDIEDLLPGEVFAEKLEATLGTCDVLIAVIGPRWLEQVKARAVSGAFDFVRQEIAWALARGLLVVPVLVGRSGHMPPLPSPHDLPEDIRDLVRRQKHDVAHERFGRDVADLARAIVILRQSARPPRPTMTWLRAGVAAGFIGVGLLAGYIILGPGAMQPPSVATKPPVKAVDAKPKEPQVADRTPIGPPPECASASSRSSGADAALTVYPDVPLYAEQFSENRVPGPPLPFRTRVTKLPGPRRGDRVLVKTADGTQCGYVAASKILDGNPLKVIDIDAYEKVQVGIFGLANNNWTIKAMLRSNPNLGASERQATTLFEEPGGKAFTTTRAFALFNVFKVDKRGSAPDEWWYFVGGKKVADDKVLSGWVRGSNLFLWGSGVAVYPVDDKGARFDVYADVQTLQEGGQRGLIATRSDLQPPKDRDVFKFPILYQIFQKASDRRDGKPPIAYEIGFFGPTGSATRGFVKVESKNIAFFAAMEPARFSLFQGSLAELCRAMSDDKDLRDRVLGLMLTLAYNLGGDPYSPAETVAEFFDRIVFIPKRHFASWLDKSATEFVNVWQTSSRELKTKLKLSACRSAYLLQQMGAGQKVDSLDDLELDAYLGKVQLKPGKSLRSYAWLWSSESKIEYYFVPAEYLPRDLD